MNTNQENLIQILENEFLQASGREVVVDSNIYLAAAEKNEDFSRVKSAIELIEGEKVRRIYITSAVYSEIEAMKKSQSNKQNEAAKVYTWFGKVLYDNNDIYKYVELEKHPDGVDDAIIKFAVEKEASFVSLDTRCNIRYFNKANIYPKVRLDEEKFIKLIQVVKHLENLQEGNLCDYLQRIFDSKKRNIVEFIQMEPEERLKTILILLVEECLNTEDEKFLEEIKKTVLKTKLGEISNKVLLKSLSKLKGYNLGDISFEESPLEENFPLVERFLKEKGFESFKELQKAQPFLTEDELVRGIIRYYEK